MSPVEVRTRETRAWLVKAHDDLESARILAGAAQRANALFHCQQCGEKSLKAFLTWRDRPFRKTHNLKELGEACAGIDSSLQTITGQGAILTDYAWRLRYPGDPYVIEEGEIVSMLVLAANLLAEIRSRIDPNDSTSISSEPR